MTQGESQRVWQAGMVLCSAEAHVRAAGEHLGNDWLVERAQLVLDAAASDHRGAEEGGV